MKNKLFVLLLLGVIMASCRVDYNYVSRDVVIGAYTAIKVDGVICVVMDDTVTTAHIVAPEDLMDNIVCEVDNVGKLTVTRRSFTVMRQGLITVYLPTNADLRNVEITGSSDLKGHLTASNLIVKVDGSSKVSILSDAIDLEADVTNAGQIRITGSADSADVDLNSALAGKIELAVLGNAVMVDADAENSSTINISGSALKLAVKADGSSTIDARHLLSVDVQVNLNNASTSYVHCSGALSGELENASTLFYAGNPQTINVNRCTSCTVTEL